MHKHFKKRLAAGLAVLSGVAGLVPANAGDVSYDFTTDPASVLTIAGNNTQPWLAAGGNPGGFLALTYPVNSQYAAIVFPNIDVGKIVTGFTFTADLRVGNGSNNGGRPADGFSISFARDGDPILADPSVDAGFGGNCCAETGTRTGVAVSFDTWAGNTFPNDPNDQTDIEGIIVRVDNVTVGKFPLLNRNGQCDAIDSLQTGPWDSQYWLDNVDDPAAAALLPGAWDTLCWQPVSVQMGTDGKLTVKWKGNTILNGFQTTYFPSAGQLVLASRTGGANENTHFDNIHLVTESATVTAVPVAPPNLTASTGARRVGLSWDAASVPGNPNAQVAYEIERDGVVLVALSTARTYEDRSVEPGKSYTYKVRGKNIAGLVGPDSTVAASTGTETADQLGFLKAEQWTGQTGASTADMDAAIAAVQGVPPNRVRYVNGFSFGETSNFGDTWGENHLVKISGVFTAPTTGNYRFYIRSDDASYLHVNTAGAAIPDGVSSLPIATESGCCGGFEAVAADGTVPEVTSEPVALVAGSKYGIAYFVKEGGGGDWGQVSIKREDDLRPVTGLTPLRGGVLTSPADTKDASVTLTTQPGPTTVTANSEVILTAAATGSSPYGGDYGNAVVYQWYDNGVPILGANGPTLSWANIPAGLNGHTFAVGAGVAGAAVAGTPFLLTVNTDTVPPVVTRVAGSPSFNSITFYFSEPVDDSALTVGNYTVTGLTLSAPVRVDNKTVKFTSSTQAENTVYPVTVNGVKDLGNNPSAFTGTFTSYQFKTGLVTYKTWQNETGAFSTFTDDPPVGAKPPTTDEIRTLFQANTGDVYENYFGQLTAFFVPPANGDYVFFMSSDDHGEMYLSTDANPANKKKIAEEPVWSSRNNWTGINVDNSLTRGEPGTLSNRSDQYPGTEWAGGAGAPITLVGGQKYYLEVLFKEGGGGDNGGATYKLASAADPANFSASTLTGNVVGTYVDPGLLPPIITTAPTSVKYAPGGTITFTVVADSAVPMTYQWFQNKKAIAGATSATLTINNADVSHIGDYRVRVSNANGSITTNDNDSRARMTGAFVVEAEDFNFDNGQTLAAANTMPLASSLFQGKDGQPGVDLSVSESTADGGANGNSLRQGWLQDGTAVPAPEGANADVISDGNAERPDFTLTQNYKIGWGDANEWFNYTRNFEPGTYTAALGWSQDGTGVDTTKFALELVSGSVTVPDQTTVVVGEITADQTSGWSSNDLIHFKTPGGSTPATFTLGANTTVRLRIVASGPDLDYLLFYKTGTPPAVTVDPAPAIPGIDANGLKDVNHNTATKTVTATTNGNSGMLKITGATRIVSVTLVGTTLTVVYE